MLAVRGCVSCVMFCYLCEVVLAVRGCVSLAVRGCVMGWIVDKTKANFWANQEITGKQ